jgi:hypothetical protein
MVGVIGKVGLLTNSAVFHFLRNAKSQKQK